MSEDGYCPICCDSTKGINWYSSNFYGDGEVTRSGNCTSCGASLYKVFKFTGIEVAN